MFLEIEVFLKDEHKFSVKDEIFRQTLYAKTPRGSSEELQMTLL
jgi:hypothetical protein